MSAITFTPQSWMFDEEGKPIRDEKVYHTRMNEHYRERYAGLSVPVLGTEIFAMPDPEWALANLIQQDGVTMLHGSPGSGKSLLGMDWAYTLAHPEVSAWMGQRKLKNYKPMYIFTEGLSGLKPRSVVWSMERGVDIPDDENGVLWVRDAVRLNRQESVDEPWSEQVAALLQMYHDYERNILFIDTLANTFGGNENSQQDANNYLAAIRMFQQYGPVVIIHHNTKEGDDYRGSTVLEGAVDTKVAVKESKGIIHLYITKQKDGDPGFNLDLRIKPTVWKELDDGRELVSVAVQQATNLQMGISRTDEETMAVMDADKGFTQTELAKMLDLPESTVKKRLDKLVERGLAVVTGEGVKGDPLRYFLAHEKTEEL